MEWQNALFVVACEGWACAFRMDTRPCKVEKDWKPLLHADAADPVPVGVDTQVVSPMQRFL